MSERIKLTYEEASAMLPAGDSVHTFIDGGMALIGADWDREEVLKLLETGAPELAGDGATSMGHGLVAWQGNQPVFIATTESAV